MLVQGVQQLIQARINALDERQKILEQVVGQEDEKRVDEIMSCAHRKNELMSLQREIDIVLLQEKSAY